MGDAKSIDTVVSNILSTYVDDVDHKYLRQDLNESNYYCFPHMRFVSFQNGHLVILCAGRCPACDCPHQRNTCNAKYVRDCIAPILATRFPQIKSVQSLNSHHPNFHSIVSGLGGSISQPVTDRDVSTLHDMASHATNKHPDFDAAITGYNFSKQLKIKLMVHDTMERFTMLRACNFYLILGDDTIFVARDGTVLQGRRSIIQSLNKLPPSICIAPHSAGHTMLSFGDTLSFFSSNQYLIVSFPSSRK